MTKNVKRAIRIEKKTGQQTFIAISLHDNKVSKRNEFSKSVSQVVCEQLAASFKSFFEETTLKCIFTAICKMCQRKCLEVAINVK